MTMQQVANLLEVGLDENVPIGPTLTVTREAGQRQCVLNGSAKNGEEIERVTTLNPQMMIDYMHAVYPGEIVRWRLVPARGPGKEAA
jgi:hypothetical protein